MPCFSLRVKQYSALPLVSQLLTGLNFLPQPYDFIGTKSSHQRCLLCSLFFKF
jgi:hypothetical protein